MSRHNFVLFAFCAFFINACSSDVFLVHNGNMPDASKISELKTGQTKSEVETLLGSPSVVSSLDDSDWIYMSSTLKKVAFFTPKVVSRDILNVRFDNQDKVISFQKLSEKDGKIIEIDKDQTTSGGHELGFFKKYFGGVGAYMPIAPSKNQ